MLWCLLSSVPWGSGHPCCLSLMVNPFIASSPWALHLVYTSPVPKKAVHCEIQIMQPVCVVPWDPLTAGCALQFSIIFPVCFLHVYT